MALSQVENRYLDMLTEREFPTMSPMESAQAMGGEQDTMPADAPIQLAQAGGAGQPQASIGPIPRNRAQEALGYVGELLSKAGVALDQYGIDIPGLGNITLKDLTVGDAGKVLEDMSFGFMPVRGGNVATGGIGTFGLKPEAVELLNVAPVAGVTASLGAKGARKAGKALAPKAGEMLSDYMQRSGLQTNLMAFHGTPHKLDKFDSSKIGTGQGAQSFGYGLYFAQNPKVAKQYSMLGQIAEIDGVPVSGKGSRVSNADAAKKLGVQESSLSRLALSDFDVGRAMKELGAEYEAAQSAGDKAFVMQQIGDLKRIMKSDVNIKAGNLYTVDIADDAVSKMLDFDAPLGQQSPEIQALAQQYNLSMNDLGGDLLAAARGKTPAGSEALRQAGVTGVRYLDQGSRDAGEGSRNIVVFPGGEDQVKIIKTEGTK